MIARDPNIQILETVVHELGPLADEFVFVGGATVGLYVDDPTAFTMVRPTQDIDCVVEVAGQPSYHAFAERLHERGFNEDPTSKVICRFKKRDLLLDLMPTDDTLGFKNIWYKDGLKNARKIDLPSGRSIQIFRTPYFVATKLEAFANRGEDDFMGSSDIEDIVTVLDGNLEFTGDVQSSDEDLRLYLKSKFRLLLDNKRFTANLEGHISDRFNSASRARTIINKMNTVVTQ